MENLNLLREVIRNSIKENLDYGLTEFQIDAIADYVAIDLENYVNSDIPQSI